MTTTKHIALTLGPILRTLDMARKTKELWAASYTFDYLARQIAGALVNHYGLETQFLKPYVSEDQKEKMLAETTVPTGGVGTFTDQVIVELPGNASLADVRKIVDGVIGEFAMQVAGHIGRSEEAVINYFHQYFQVYMLEKGEAKQPILDLSPMLPHLELQRNFPQVHQPFLEDFFNRVNGSFLAKEAFGRRLNVPSIPEISLKTFTSHSDWKEIPSTGNEDDDDEKMMNVAPDFAAKHKLDFHGAHHYIAIVKFDGDRVGKLLEQHYHKAAEISQKLSEFAGLAAKRVWDYGGFPVFFGGDDALFFAPVVVQDPSTKHKRHIFQLLSELDKLFQQQFQSFGEMKPTLSFGLSISYYKFPLYEALKTADELLFVKAKPKDDRRHNLAFKVLKHSGSDFEAILHLSSDTFKKFSDLLDKIFNKPSLPFHSVVYKIREAKIIYDTIAGDRESVVAFLKNSFNEAVHDDKQEFFREDMPDIIQAVYSEVPLTDANDRLFDLLKTILFLAQTEKSNDHEELQDDAATADAVA